MKKLIYLSILLMFGLSTFAQTSVIQWNYNSRVGSLIIDGNLGLLSGEDIVDGTYSAGVYSKQLIEQGNSGFIEYEPHGEEDGIIGLSYEDVSTLPANIPFYFKMDGQNLSVYNQGTKIGTSVTLSTVESIKLEVDYTGNSVKYFLNGALHVVASGITITADLSVDVIFKKSSIQINPIQGQGFVLSTQCSTGDPAHHGRDVNWDPASKLNVITSLSHITSTSEERYCSGVISNDFLPAGENGWFLFVIEDPDNEGEIGFTYQNYSPSAISILYGLKIQDGNLLIKDNANYVAISTVNTGDVFKIERLGSQILFKRGECVFYTIFTATQPPLYIDISLKEEGDQFYWVKESLSFTEKPYIPLGDQSTSGYPIKWDLSKVSCIEIDQNTSVLKSEGTAAGVFSLNKLAANVDGWVELKTTSTSDGYFGLSEMSKGFLYEEADYLTRVLPTRVNIVDNVTQNTSGQVSIKQGNIVRVERTGDQILYKRNGYVYANHSCDPSKELHVVVSFDRTYGNLVDLVSSVTSLGTNITKEFDNSFLGELVNWDNTTSSNITQSGVNITTSTSGAGFIKSEEVINANQNGWIEVEGFKIDKKFSVGLVNVTVPPNQPEITYGITVENNKLFYNNDGAPLEIGFINECNTKLRVEKRDDKILLKQGNIVLHTLLLSEPIALSGKIELIDNGQSIESTKMYGGNTLSKEIYYQLEGLQDNTVCKVEQDKQKLRFEFTEKYSRGILNFNIFEESIHHSPIVTQLDYAIPLEVGGNFLTLDLQELPVTFEIGKTYYLQTSDRQGEKYYLRFTLI